MQFDYSERFYRCFQLKSYIMPIVHNKIVLLLVISQIKTVEVEISSTYKPPYR